MKKTDQCRGSVPRLTPADVADGALASSQIRESRPEAACHKSLSLKEIFGGARRNRTADLLNAIQALSQLSYGPTLAAGLGTPRKGSPPKQRAFL